VIALAAAVAVAAVVGVWWRSRQGRLTDGRPAAYAWDDLGVELGDRATFVQFSSAFCQPCRATRVVLSQLVGQVEGVSHREVDAESHLDAVRALGVHKTPTTLVLDGRGREVARAAGVPRREQVLALLGRIDGMATPRR
jgi:thiol-disulfide isomerase/thioredoxin